MLDELPKMNVCSLRPVADRENRRVYKRNKNNIELNIIIYFFPTPPPLLSPQLQSSLHSHGIDIVKRVMHHDSNLKI